MLVGGILLLASVAGIGFSLFMLFGDPFAQRTGGTYRPNWEDIGEVLLTCDLLAPGRPLFPGLPPLPPRQPLPGGRGLAEEQKDPDRLAGLARPAGPALLDLVGTLHVNP